VAPVLRIAVLQPEDARRDIGRHVLGVGRVHQMRWTSRHEDLNGFVVIAVGTLIERTPDAGLALSGAQPAAAWGARAACYPVASWVTVPPNVCIKYVCAGGAFQIRCLSAPMLH
jgi:hypothetical protein